MWRWLKILLLTLFLINSMCLLGPNHLSASASDSSGLKSSQQEKKNTTAGATVSASSKKKPSCDEGSCDDENCPQHRCHFGHCSFSVRIENTLYFIAKVTRRTLAPTPQLVSEGFSEPMRPPILFTA